MSSPRFETMALAAFLSFALLGRAVADEFPQPTDTQAIDLPFTSPAEGLAKLTLPAGFRATLFAAEPDVQNPIALDLDQRGRLWIAENYTYADGKLKFDLSLRDRIVILDGAGSEDQHTGRKVFSDNLQMLTSVAVGDGGVWAMCPPRLMFIPDRDGDDMPDGPAEVVLDGFTVSEKSYHNYANGLKFGPDGWLYGRCGGSCPGEIGLPDTPTEERLPLRGGIWRYHPTRKVVEVVNYGTTNPWGHDWDRDGELFFINTVNGHLWHGFSGAHYHRTHTLEPNPRVYRMIDQHSDHWHFDTSQDWTKSRDGAARDYGGGHAHVGMMIYQGDNWPADYRGRLFTINLHGRCANQDILEPEGSGYVGRHGKNLILSDDPWFRGMDLTYGPDGRVLLIDWCDIGECHDRDGVHRTSGRVYKIGAEGTNNSASPGNIGTLDGASLVALHSHHNEWYSRQARLELARRKSAGIDLSAERSSLRKMFDTDPLARLRALWSLYVIGAADEPFLCEQLHHTDEHVRVWAIRLLTDFWPLDTATSHRPARALASNKPSAGGVANDSQTSTAEIASSASPTEKPVNAELLQSFVDMAANDQSAPVRLALACVLQRLPLPQRTRLAAALASHAEDAKDHNLPLMIWYGLIPLGDSAPQALIDVAGTCALPDVRRFVARRLGEDIDERPAPVDALLALAIEKPAAFQADVINGLSEALAGRHQARRPTAWDRVAPVLAGVESAELQEKVRELDALFGDEEAIARLRATALDVSAEATSRQAAFQMLVRVQPADLRALCEQLLDDATLGPVAVRGLARNKDTRIAKLLIDHYDRLPPPARAAAVDALAARAAFSHVLLDAVAKGRVPRTDITSYHVRQMRGLKDKKLDEVLTDTWGALRDVSADKQELIASLKRKLTPAVLAAADPSAGRALFNKTCATCHRLYGEGQTIGPDLTGAGRDNLQYLLDNIADPSAVVTADFRMSVLATDDGRTLNGVVVQNTPQTVTLQTATERLIINRSEIVEQQVSPLSLMPEGLLAPLSETQVRDLIAYLMTKQQVGLPDNQ